MLRIFVGLDVYKESITVAIAAKDGGEIRYYGKIKNTPDAIKEMVHEINLDGEVMSFCYEAGACGYMLYRQLISMGHDCTVVAPSLIPSKPGDRVKTDRRDRESLVRLYRAGELTAVWVPDAEQESVRDLTRAREDMKHLERQSRQRLSAFLLRHGKRYDLGKRNGHWPIFGGWNNKRLITRYSKLSFRNISIR